jgi:hypothetical protein
LRCSSHLGHGVFCPEHLVEGHGQCPAPANGSSR